MIGLLAVMLSSARAMGSPPGIAEQGRTVYRDLMIPFAALFVGGLLKVFGAASCIPWASSACGVRGGVMKGMATNLFELLGNQRLTRFVMPPLSLVYTPKGSGRIRCPGGWGVA